MVGYSKEQQVGKLNEKPKKQSILKKGKATKNWDNARADLKPLFVQAGITTCEVCIHLPEPHRSRCGRSEILSFAHTKKKKANLTREDLRRVVLCCIPGHMVIEGWNRHKMETFLEKIIASRPPEINKILLGEEL